MDPPPEHEIIGRGFADNHEVNERLLDRLRRNDPTLKELTLYNIQRYEQTSLQILDAIATNSSLKVLDLDAWTFLDHYEAKHRLTRALITNTSVKHLRLRLRRNLRLRPRRNTVSGWVAKVLDIIRASPNLEALTLLEGDRLSIEDIAAMVPGLCVHTNLHTLTIDGFRMHTNRAAAFAAAFQANQTIKTLIIGWRTIAQDAELSFVEALPHDHSLETIIFDEKSFEVDHVFKKFEVDHVVSIVRTLCRKHLKNLCFLSNRPFSQDDYERYERIVQTLKENEHCLTIEGPFARLPAKGEAFATAFQANQTIKTLIMRDHAIYKNAGVSFAEALPHDHSLETIIFEGIIFDDDHVVSIVRTLCGKHLKNLSILNKSRVSQDGYERIIQILKENEHSFIKLHLFPDSEHSPWQNKIQLEIDMLTWENRLQVEKDTWVDRFLEQHTSSRELLFLALERAKNVDNQQFSKAPNLLFHLIKESPELMAQAIRNGL